MKIRKRQKIIYNSRGLILNVEWKIIKLLNIRPQRTNRLQKTL